MKSIILLGFILTSIVAFSQQEKAQREVKTGGIKMITIDGKYQVWTKKVGNGAIKVLLLHGGPGAPHDYFECFEDFLPQAGIEFYYYDQLGCGNSDIPTDTSLWKISRYIEEVEQVRQGLGLENFYLLGHSWGSMLTMEYLQKYQSHVKAAILCNMTASMESSDTYASKLKQKFFTPLEISLLDSLENLRQFDSPEYQRLLRDKYYNNTTCLLNPWPEPWLRALKKANTNIYFQVYGPYAFYTTGSFKDWNMWDRLKNIKVPTLVIGGMNDSNDPEDMVCYSAVILSLKLPMGPK